MFGGNPNPLAAAAAPGMFFPPPGMTTPGFPGMEQLFLGGGPGGIPGFHPGNFPGNQPQFFHSLGAGGAPGQFGNQFRFPGAGRGLGRGFLPGGGRGFTPMGRGGRGQYIYDNIIAGDFRKFYDLFIYFRSWRKSWWQPIQTKRQKCY